MGPVLARMRHSKIADERPLSGDERSCSGHHRMAEFDPGCVKTHTSAKCRKNNSPATHRSSSVQYDLTLRYGITPRCFYVRGEHRSFHTTKTRSGQGRPFLLRCTPPIDSRPVIVPR